MLPATIRPGVAELGKCDAALDQATVGLVQRHGKFVGKHLHIGLAEKHRFLDSQQLFEGRVGREVAAVEILDIKRQWYVSQRFSKLLAGVAQFGYFPDAGSYILHAEEHPLWHSGPTARPRSRRAR